MTEEQKVAKIYGASGCGSAITEIMYTLAGEPYQYVDVEGFDRPGEARDRLSRINPLAQVPTVILPDGTILTETAAIGLQLLEHHPELAPAQREHFYRLLIWIVANVYPTFTYGDYPTRWTLLGERELVASTDRYRQQLWLWFESQLSESPYVFGDRISLIDAYLAAIVAWRPCHDWFKKNTPKINRIANNVRQREAIDPIITRNKL